MKFFMKLSATILLLTIVSSTPGYFYRHKPSTIANSKNPSNVKTNTENDKAVMAKLRGKVGIIKKFARENNYNTTYCFMADMHIVSGRKRFFVYNMKNDSVELTGLVAHGSGSDKREKELYFSNTPNSNCTSLGKYKIGKSYYGKFGLAYKLYGLDKTNDKAFERFVVLHAHECVPDAEIISSGICESWGCPTVSAFFLSELKNYIDRSEKPVLLWIYY